MTEKSKKEFREDAYIPLWGVGYVPGGVVDGTTGEKQGKTNG